MYVGGIISLTSSIFHAFTYCISLFLLMMPHRLSESLSCLTLIYDFAPSSSFYSPTFASFSGSL